MIKKFYWRPLLPGLDHTKPTSFFLSRLSQSIIIWLSVYHSHFNSLSTIAGVALPVCEILFGVGLQVKLTMPLRFLYFTPCAGILRSVPLASQVSFWTLDNICTHLRGIYDDSTLNVMAADQYLRLFEDSVPLVYVPVCTLGFPKHDVSSMGIEIYKGPSNGVTTAQISESSLAFYSMQFGCLKFVHNMEY